MRFVVAGLLVVVAGCAHRDSSACAREQRFACTDGGQRVCETDARGCKTCSCERGVGPRQIGPNDAPNTINMPPP